MSGGTFKIDLETGEKVLVQATKPLPSRAEQRAMAEAAKAKPAKPASKGKDIAKPDAPIGALAPVAETASVESTEDPKPSETTSRRGGTKSK